MSPKPLPELDIESLDHDAQGVGHSSEGKVVFVEGALPGERVSAITTNERVSTSATGQRIVTCTSRSCEFAGA